MIDRERAALASRNDRKLLRRIHPVGVPILDLLARRGPAVRLPRVGVVVSDAALIREILLDRQAFTKIGEGVASSFWTPILGRQALINMDGEEHRLMKRSLAASFSQAICPAIVAQVMAGIGPSITARLLAGESVDVAREVDQFAYRAIWALLGLPANTIEGDRVWEAVTDLKAVIGGITVTRTTLPRKQIKMANSRLAKIDAIARQAYRDATDRSTIPGLMRAEGYDEEAAVSVVKVMMVAGTETIVGFLPRMTALFIDSGYLRYLHDDPAHLPNGINEAMRYTMPTAVDARSVVAPMTYRGLQLRRGERMVLSLINAGLRYGDFDPFQSLDRNVRGLWFGAGVHMCIGLPLAMAQAEAFAALLVDVSQQGELVIERRVAARHGHLGAYSSLVLRCVRS